MWIKFLPAVLFAAVQIASAQSYSVLYEFSGTNDGANPERGVVADSAGNLYGSTLSGGRSDFGTVFELPATGGEKLLHEFSGNWDGAYPDSGVTLDSAGNIYATAEQGGYSWCQDFGCGLVLKLGATGSIKALRIFKDGLDGGFPFGGLSLDSAGDLYGSTLIGGLGYGVIFKMDPTGREQVLYNFSGPDGSGPYTKLVHDSVGNLYGATEFGGVGSCSGLGCGVIFRLDTHNQLTVLHAFTGGSDGAIPANGTLAFDSAGNIYGMTNYGGDLSCVITATPGCGVVYKLDQAGNLTVLYSFHHGADGALPSSGILRDNKGNLYGSTSVGGDFSGTCANFNLGCGVIFQLSPTGDETILHAFQYDDGSAPSGDLMFRQGFLYGTTIGGGAELRGVVFKLQP